MQRRMRKRRLAPCSIAAHGNVIDGHEVPGTEFLVNAFTWRCPETQHWFLTDFHSDHYRGLDRSFRGGLIYCTKTTSTMCQAKLQVPANIFRELQLDQGEVIDNVLVTALDANNGPDSAMLLFQHRDGTTILHCGRIRWHLGIKAIPALAPPLLIDHLYLDVTDSRDNRHRMKGVIDRLVDFLQPLFESDDTLFCIGLCENRILLRLADEFQCPIWASVKTLSDLDQGEVFTTDPHASRVHAIDDISYPALRAHLKLFGLNYKSVVALGLADCSSMGDRLKVVSHDNLTIVRIPYSDQSSPFPELLACLRYLLPTRITSIIKSGESAYLLDRIRSLIDTPVMSSSDVKTPPKGRSVYPNLMRRRTWAPFPTLNRFTKGVLMAAHDRNLIALVPGTKCEQKRCLDGFTSEFACRDGDVGLDSDDDDVFASGKVVQRRQREESITDDDDIARCWHNIRFCSQCGPIVMLPRNQLLAEVRLRRTRSLLVDPINDECGSTGVTPRSPIHVVVAVCGLAEPVQQICCRLVRYLTWKGHRTRLFATRASPLLAKQPHNNLRDACEEGLEFTNEGGVAIIDTHDANQNQADWMATKSKSRHCLICWILADDAPISLPDDASWIRVRYSPNFVVDSDNIRGCVCKMLLRFVSYLSLKMAPIFISRHGESCDNLGGFIGGDSYITERGRQFAVALGSFIDEKNLADLQVWTSCLRRATATAEYIQTASSKCSVHQLQEIHAGEFTGLTYDEIRENHPEGYAARKKDKLSYCYPSGESYIDVINRIDSIIMEMEKADYPILVIAHKAVLRCLLGYFLHTQRVDIPDMMLPSHAVFQLDHSPHGIRMDTYELGIDHVENTIQQPRPASHAIL